MVMLNYPKTVLLPIFIFIVAAELMKCNLEKRNQATHWLKAVVKKMTNADWSAIAEAKRVKATIGFKQFNEHVDPQQYAGVTFQQFDNLVASLQRKYHWSSTAEGRRIVADLHLAKLAAEYVVVAKDFSYIHNKGRSMFARIVTVNLGGKMDMAIAYSQGDFEVIDRRQCYNVCNTQCHKKCKRGFLWKKKCWQECKPVCRQECKMVPGTLDANQRNALKTYFIGRAIEEFRKKFGSILLAQ